MLSPAALVALLLLILLAVWAGVSLRVAYDRVSAVLRQTRSQLDRLQLEAVCTAEDDQTVQEVFDRIAVDSASIGRAWQDFTSTVAMVDGRPRATTGCADVFHADRFIMQETERRGMILSPRALTHLPARLQRLAAVLAMIVAVVAWVGPAGIPAVTTIDALPAHVMPGLAQAVGVLVVGMLLAMAVRMRRTQALDDLDWAVGRVTGWVEARYQRVTAEELLARLLAQSPAQRP